MGTYEKGKTIELDGPIDYERLIRINSCAVFSAKHKDTDYLKRICDDNFDLQNCGPGLNGQTIDHVDAGDALIYEWSARNINFPQFTGNFKGTANAWAVLWQPDFPGEYEICLRVRNRPGQALDDEVTLPPIPFRVWVVPGFFKFEAKAPFGVWKELKKCHGGGGTPPPGGGRLIVVRNDDDDNRDALADLTTAVQKTVGENDLVALKLTNITTLPTPNLKIQFGLLGAVSSIALYEDPLKIDVTNPTWRTLSSPMTIYVEGVEAHAEPDDVQILVMLNDDPSAYSEYSAIIPVDVTVIAVSSVAFLSDGANGKGEAIKWDAVNQAGVPVIHPLERPKAFEDAALAAKSYYIHPEADPAIDSPTVNGWEDNERHKLKVIVTVTPKIAGIDVYVSPRDVDDNSYTLNGGTFDAADRARRNFDDPGDRMLATFDVRRDNNDVVSLGAAVTSEHGAIVGATGNIDMHKVPTDEAGQVTVEFVSTVAPGDNFRILASVAADILNAANVPPTILALLPDDFEKGGYEGYSTANERKAAVCFSVADEDKRQQTGTKVALEVYETPDTFNVAASHHTMASNLLTVRRRLFIEELSPQGFPAVAWNLDINPFLENGSSAITRYVTRVESVGGGGHREFIVGPRSGGLTEPNANLQRKISKQVYVTASLTRPFPGPFPIHGTNDESPNYGAPRHNLVPGKPPPTIADGAFQGGEVALAPNTTLCHVFASGLDALYIKSIPDIEFRIFQAGVWVSSPNYRFTIMKPHANGTELVFKAALAAALPVGTLVRVGAGTAAVPGQGNIVSATPTSMIIGNTAGGASFRFQVLLYDDTSWLFRSRNAEPSAVSISATKAGVGGTINLPNYYLRDACLGIVRLGPPYRNTDWQFEMNVPYAKLVGGYPAFDVLTRGGLLNSSRLLFDYKLAQNRCWTHVLMNIPDGSAGIDLKGDWGWSPVDDDSDGEAGRIAGGQVV